MQLAAAPSSSGHPLQAPPPPPPDSPPDAPRVVVPVLWELYGDAKAPPTASHAFPSVYDYVAVFLPLREAVLGRACGAIPAAFKEVLVCRVLKPMPAAAVEDTTAIPQMKLIGRCVEQLMKAKAASVMCQGYRSRRSGTGTSQFENHFPNTVNRFLCGRDWRDLLSVAGSGIMGHLLMDTCIFHPVGHACYVQLTGPRAAQELLASRKASADAKRKARSVPTAVTAPVPPSIDRSYLFYVPSFARSAGFPANHALTRLAAVPDSNSQARKLAAYVFMGKFTRTPHKRVLAVLPAFRAMLSRFRKCDFAQLLRKHAPLPPEAAAKDAPPPIDAALSHRQVFDFVRSVLLAVVPAALWGTPAGKRALLARVYMFLGLGRNDGFTMTDAMHGIPVSGFTWAAPAGHSTPHDSRVQLLLVRRWVYWLLANMVVPAIRSHFYVTDSEAFRNRTLYFRKTLWARFVHATEGQLQATGQLRRLDAAVADAKLRAPSRVLGAARARFLPKATGMRAIVNLASTARPLPSAASVAKAKPGGRKSPAPPPAGRLHRSPTESTMSINRILDDVHHALKLELSPDSDMLGCTVRGLDDIYHNLLAFLPAARSPRRALYYVAVDVSKCYDTIDQGRLISLVDTVLHDEYRLQKFTSVHPGALVGGMRGPRVRFRKEAMLPHQHRNFVAHAEAMAATSRNVVFYDNVTYPTLHRGRLLGLLRQHVFEHVVMMRGHFYAQEKGIPQGSVLSTLLCNYYYAAFEKEAILPALGGRSARDGSPPPASRKRRRVTFDLPAEGGEGGGGEGAGAGAVDPPHLVLMRLTDDYLLVTDDKAAATAFVAATHTGSPAHGFAVNPAKTVASFEVEVPAVDGGDPPTRVPAAVGDVAWCGLLFKPATCEVAANYARYQAPHRVSDAVAMPGSVPPSAAGLTHMLHSFCRPKCHALLFDARINSVEVVATNVLQLTTLVAAKMLCVLPRPRFAAVVHPATLHGVIVDCMAYVHRLVVSRVTRHGPTPDGTPAKYALYAHETAWVGMRAFHAVLATRRGVYGGVLDLLAADGLMQPAAGVSQGVARGASNRKLHAFLDTLCLM